MFSSALLSDWLPIFFSGHPKGAQDPYSKTAQEKARLEAQQRLMGIDTNKKPKKKTKKKSLGVFLLMGIKIYELRFMSGN